MDDSVRFDRIERTLEKLTEIASRQMVIEERVSQIAQRSGVAVERLSVIELNVIRLDKQVTRNNTILAGVTGVATIVVAIVLRSILGG